MRYLVGSLLLIGVVLFGQAAFAQEKGTAAVPDEKAAFRAIAQARTEAELALRDCRAVMDDQKSGWRSTYDIMNKNREDASRMLDVAQQKEGQKGEARDQAFIDECQRRRRSIDVNWREMEVKARPPLEVSYRDAVMTYQRLSNVMYRLMDLENSWKDTNLDLAILKPLYETVDKQAKQAKAQADKALEDLKKLAMLWEDSLKQVKAYVGERGAE